MLSTFVDFFFGCTHKNTTFPISTRTAKAQRPTGTYVVCLDCGKEFAYDWDEMRVVNGRESEAPPVVEQVRSFSASK